MLPVRLLGYTISEEAFDTHLNPIRATVSLSMRVLNYSDLDTSHPGYHEFLAYQQGLEAIASRAVAGNPNQTLGVNVNQL